MGIKICIDAGHYGKYNRSPAIPEYYESDMVWKLHLLQKQYLEEYEGVTVITTRENQATDKALYDRGVCSKGCDLFISDHSNAVGSGVNNSVDYPAAYCAINGSADGIGMELAQCVEVIIDTSQKARIEHRRGKNGDYYGVLRGATAVGTPALILEHSFHTNTGIVRWLMDEGNLDRLARAEAEAIAAYYGLVKKGQPASNAGKVEQTGDNAETIWNFLKGKGFNDFAIAGIMGNLKKESNLFPNNLQNVYEKKYGFTDAEYTAAVDAGTYGNFVHDSAGYGLAQWTYWSRKAALMEFAQAAGVSVGDLNMQLEFFWKEIQGYKSVMAALNSATSVLSASNAVLTGYEKPANQGEAVQKERAAYGQEYFDRFAGKSAGAAHTFPYTVRVDIPDLNIRKGAGTNFPKTGRYTGKGVFTIVEEADGQINSRGEIGRWGLLKSYQKNRDGWICLSLGMSVTEKN